MTPGHNLYFILLACILSSALLPAEAQQDKARHWFESEYGSFFQPESSDDTPPVIYGIDVSPSTIKSGDPRAEINAFVYDPSGLSMVYAEVGGRMNLMLDLDLDHRYTGYCGSNMPVGSHPVSIVAIDKAGNAAMNDGLNMTVLDPMDLNGNRIDDSLEVENSLAAQGEKDLRVIVLHDGNLTGTAAKKFNLVPGSSMTIPGKMLSELSRMNGVKGIYRDQKLKVLASPGRDFPGRLAVDDPRKDHSRDGEGVTVALLDTGVDPNHVALEADKDGAKIIAFKDFVGGQEKAYDDNGHGTHCADLIVGEDGVAPGARLVVVKVMDRDGACYLSDAIRALDWCLENRERYGIDIISFSVGGDGPSDGKSLLDEACNKVVEEGVVMCVAAGNSGPRPGSIVFPGGAERVITVGAIDSSGRVFDLSSRGPAADGETKPDVVTIGVDVLSALAGSKDGRSSVSGTSMAVPQVSGSCALLIEADPDLTPADIKRILLKTADDLGKPGPDNDYGWGALNIERALKSLGRESEPKPPSIEVLKLSRDSAGVGDPVVIEASVEGDVKDVTARVVGEDRSLEIPMDDFDGNGVYSAWWETSFWEPGRYDVLVELRGKYGESASLVTPFRLIEKS